MNFWERINIAAIFWTNSIFQITSPLNDMFRACVKIQIISKFDKLLSRKLHYKSLSLEYRNMKVRSLQKFSTVWVTSTIGDFIRHIDKYLSSLHVSAGSLMPRSLLTIKGKILFGIKFTINIKLAPQGN